MINQKPVAIDLFCGAGGLTLGLKKAGFEVVAGVELRPEIAKTYKANHRKTKLLVKDVKQVTGEELFKLTGKEEIDLVAGCPPCQGFSQLTEKYKRDDPRNGLVLEMARIIEETKPRMVMMENVPRITTKGKEILDGFVEKLKSLGYVVNMGILQMADYGVPQSRRRFVLLAGRGFEISLPKRTHAYKADSKENLKPWLTLSEAIRGFPKPVKLSFTEKNDGPEKFNWHVVRDLQKISIDRLKAIKQGDNRLALPRHLRPKCHKTKKAGFHNVYGRLRWNYVSSSITTGCTTVCMGRFGHPIEDRTISVREAALIQTFPFNYRFKTKFISTACNLVGNALPPRFAEIAGKNCFNALRNFEGVKNG
ncbi:MAG: DNA cytosine methyltransferase [Candidatus Omnitrophota bacterium]|nr:DNA cytosine methyltransferase [Candidatus Omnitrophota bacterium]